MVLSFLVLVFFSFFFFWEKGKKEKKNEKKKAGSWPRCEVCVRCVRVREGEVGFFGGGSGRSGGVFVLGSFLLSFSHSLLSFRFNRRSSSDENWQPGAEVVSVLVTQLTGVEHWQCLSAGDRRASPSVVIV